MSDVIWAAVIAGGVAVAGNVTTYLVSQRASQSAIATANKQAEVELEKLAADVERVKREFSEPERSNRQGTYHRLLAILQRMHMFASGFVPTDEGSYGATLEEFNVLVTGVHLFGRTEVRVGLEPIGLEMEQLGARINELRRADPEASYAQHFATAYGERAGEITNATAVLIEAMRTDVTREILDEGQQ